MSAENRVSITVSPEDQTVITNAIVTLKTTLTPYLISLKPEERQELPKMKDKTIAFVNKTINYAVNNSEFSPPFLSTRELNKDINAVNALNPFLVALEQIVMGLDDTIMSAGSEAYIASLSYYNSVKQAAKMNVPNAKTIYEDLKTRFPQRTAKTEPEPVS